jgi:hypothetical protein
LREAERQPHDRELGRRPHKLSIAAVWLLAALENEGWSGRGKKRPLPPEKNAISAKSAMSQLQSSIHRQQALMWIRWSDFQEGMLSEARLYGHIGCHFSSPLWKHVVQSILIVGRLLPSANSLTV